MASTRSNNTIKRSVMIAGHATSITLEPEFWNKLKEIAAIDNVSLNSLITKIDADKDRENLSSAVRVFILKRLCGE